MRRALLFLGCFLGACGDDSAAPAASATAQSGRPEARTDAHPALAPLLPAELLLYAEAPSVAAFEQAAPWVAPLLSGRELSVLLAVAVELDAEDVDLSGPMAVGLAGPRPSLASWFLVVPVHDALRAAAALRDRKDLAVHATDTHVALCADPSWRPAAELPAAARALPAGVVRGAVDVPSFVESFEAHVLGSLPVAPLALRDALRALGRATFAVQRDGDVLELDVEIETDAGTAEPPDLTDLVRRLPRDAPVLLAADVDLGLVGDVLQLLAELAVAAEPSLETGEIPDALLLDRGLAATLSMGKTGLELTSISGAHDPARLLDSRIELVAGQISALYPGVEVERGNDEVLGGVSTKLLFVRPGLSGAGLSSLVEGGTVLAFRAVRVPDLEGWSEQDRNTIRARVRTERPEETRSRIEVLGDDEWLFVLLDPIGDTSIEEDGELVREVLGMRGVVRLRRAVSPDHASYGAYRSMLEQMLETEGDERARAYRIEPGERTARDRERGAFPAGLSWQCLAPGVERSVHERWRHEGYFLVALDDVELGGADVSWAYVSSARLGPWAKTRDVAFRIRPASRDRAEALTSGAGPVDLVALVDEEVVAGVRLTEPLATEGQFEKLPRARARRLAWALAHRPLHASYEFVGWRFPDFVQAWQERAAFARVFGKRGLPVRAAAVDRYVLVAVGRREGHIAEALAAARGERAEPAPAFGASLARVPWASVLVRVDVPRLLQQWEETIAALADQDRAPRSDLPEGVEPVLLAGGRGPAGLRLLLRVDGRLPTFMAEQQQQTLARLTASEMAWCRRNVERWQETNATDALPTEEQRASDPVLASHVDPWGLPLRLEPTEDGASFRVVSAGPDGRFGTGDDIVDEGGG